MQPENKQNPEEKQEKGTISAEITEEMEKSVRFYRMQTLELSLIALIANRMITLDDALAASIHPDDLKLMFSQLGFDEEGNYIPMKSDHALTSKNPNEGDDELLSLS